MRSHRLRAHRHTAPIFDTPGQILARRPSRPTTEHTTASAQPSVHMEIPQEIPLSNSDRIVRATTNTIRPLDPDALGQLMDQAGIPRVNILHCLPGDAPPNHTDPCIASRHAEDTAAAGHLAQTVLSIPNYPGTYIVGWDGQLVPQEHSGIASTAFHQVEPPPSSNPDFDFITDSNISSDVMNFIQDDTPNTPVAESYDVDHLVELLDEAEHAVISADAASHSLIGSASAVSNNHMEETQPRIIESAPMIAKEIANSPISTSSDSDTSRSSDTLTTATSDSNTSWGSSELAGSSQRLEEILDPQDKVVDVLEAVSPLALEVPHIIATSSIVQVPDTVDAQQSSAAPHIVDQPDQSASLEAALSALGNQIRLFADLDLTTSIETTMAITASISEIVRGLSQNPDSLLIRDFLESHH